MGDYGQDMIAVELVDVRLEMPGRVHVVLLREREGDRRVLPIYIGEPEASSIQLAVSGRVPPRPLTHDLVVNILGSLGAVLDKVVITDVSNGTFYAELRLTGRAELAADENVERPPHRLRCCGRCRAWRAACQSRRQARVRRSGSPA